MKNHKALSVWKKYRALSCVDVILACLVLGFISRLAWTCIEKQPMDKTKQRPISDRYIEAVWNQEVQEGRYPGGVSINTTIRWKIPKAEKHVPNLYWDPTHNVTYPRRPVHDGVLDFIRIQEHCSYDNGQFVRDCLEILRVGAGLDTQATLRHGPLDTWRYVRLQPSTSWRAASAKPRPHCAVELERVFHMFWAGPLTDKIYFTILSFLFTQDLQLHVTAERAAPCRPQLWIWMHMLSNSTMRTREDDLRNMLSFNPWSAPFLHPRFSNTIQFKIWNTLEQLKAIPELAQSWDLLDRANFSDEDAAPSMMDSSHVENYDHVSVVLSDLARFVLCHRFGGVYVDADVIFLRDWAELLRAPWAFAYRWSRLPAYNTAVLRLRRGSALGSFILRSALLHDLNLHPMAITRYLTDAGLDPMLARLPDALFDPAWLNADYLQRERPPHPYFTDFSDFFDTPLEVSAATQASGFEGFFRGAYAYHWHNFWWRPVDPVRRVPDLGPRFTPHTGMNMSSNRTEDTEEDSFVDLSWSTVLKRTFEAYIRGERPNMYGEWLSWDDA